MAALKVFLTSTSAAIQSTTIPADWTDVGAILEGLAPGGNGANGATGASGVSGGGGAGGGYVKRTTPGLSPGQTVYYQQAAGGSGVDSWFNDLNLLIQTSNALSNAAWTKTNATVADSQTDPLGGTNAAQLTENSTNSQHIILQVLNKAASTARTYRWSATVKSANRNVGFYLWLNSSAVNAGCAFDLQGLDTGVGTVIGYVTTNSAIVTVSNGAITSLGSGWYRISATINITATGTDPTIEYQISLFNPGAGTAANYLGNGSAGVTIYGVTSTYGTVDKGFVGTTTAPAYSLLAKAGPGGANQLGGTAPSTGGQGDTVNNGGNGGSGGTARGGGGGGAAGGPAGAGKAGGAPGATSGGAGGGGADGTSATVGANPSTTTGAAGGQGVSGTGSGAGSASGTGTAGTAGTGAGGGGGFLSATAAATSNGGAGASTTEFDATHGAGGGGGGGGGNSSTTNGPTVNGGAGALYGAGGGGAGYSRATTSTRTGGLGAQGIFVLTYTSSGLVTGTLSVTLDPLTLAATGAVLVKGSLNVTLGALTLAGTGTAPISTGSLSVTLGALTLLGAGSAPAQGTLNTTLGALTLAGTGKVLAQGLLNITLDPLTLSAIGKVPSQGSLAVTLDPLTLAGSGTVANQVFTGTLNQTLGPLTLLATAKVLVQGSLNITLGGLVLAASGTVVNQVSTGSLSVTLGPLTLAGTGSVPVRGSLNVLLDALTLAGVAKAPAQGALDSQLGALTLAGSGTVSSGGPPPSGPPVTTGLAVWLDASQLALADGADVATWPNLGSGATPAMVGAPLPKMKAAASPTGKPAVRFSTNEGRLRGTTTIVQDYTLLYVVRLWGTYGGRAYSGRYPDSGNYLIGFHTSNMDTMYDEGFIGSATTAIANIWKLYEADGTTGTGIYVSRFFIDGILKGTMPAGGTGIRGYYNLSGYDATGLQETGDFDVTELLIYDHQLSDAERLSVENYLRSKWIVAGPTTSTGTLSVTLDPMALAATGKVINQGTLSISLDPLTLNATGRVPAQATLSVTLDALTLAATAKALIRGALGTTLDPLALAGTARALARASANILLGDLGLMATGKTLVRGALDVVLDNLVLDAHGLAPIPVSQPRTISLRAVKQPVEIALGARLPGNVVVVGQRSGRVALEAAMVRQVRLTGVALSTKVPLQASVLFRQVLHGQ